MFRLFSKYPIRFVSLLIFVIILSFHIFNETWVYRTFPYSASAETIAVNYKARNFVSLFYKPDSLFQSLIGKFQNDKPYPDIVLLDVDYELWQKYDTWPLPRSVYAEILNKLYEYKPRILMLDYMFSTPQTPWVLKAIGGELQNRSSASTTRLLRKLDHDGQLRKALAKFKYSMVYNFIGDRDYATTAQKKKALSRLGYQASRATKYKITGDNELALFPFFRAQGVRQSIIPFQLRAGAQGYAWLLPDRYGTYSKVALFHRLQTTSKPPKSLYLSHVSTETARLLLDARDYGLHIDDGRAKSLTIKDHNVDVDKFGEININFYNASKRERKLDYVKAYDLLYREVPKEALQNKIVILGTSTKFNVNDYHETPVGLLWGTEIVGYILSNILNNDHYTRPTWAPWLEGLLLVAVFIAAVIGLNKLKPTQVWLYYSSSH